MCSPKYEKHWSYSKSEHFKIHLNINNVRYLVPHCITNGTRGSVENEVTKMWAFSDTPVLCTLGAGILNTFGIPMVALCLVFQWPVLPDLAIYRHLGNFLNHLAISFFYLAILKFGSFLGYFSKKLKKNCF